VIEIRRKAVPGNHFQYALTGDRAGVDARDADARRACMQFCNWLYLLLTQA